VAVSVPKEPEVAILKLEVPPVPFVAPAPTVITAVV
jgi:hypothetical protein